MPCDEKPFDGGGDEAVPGYVFERIPPESGLTAEFLDQRPQDTTLRRP